MYLAIDLGGTKTLLAVFDDSGNIVEEKKIPTPKDYEEFVENVSQNVAAFTTKEFEACGFSVSGLLNRETGVVHALGNLPWIDKPIRDDISKAIGGVPTTVENDARTAGLSEAQWVLDQHKNVLYITIGTGIGGAVIENGNIVKALQDTEMGKIPLYHDRKLIHWEDFASGRAIVERYGKKASEIEDPEIWQEIAHDIAYGVGILSTVIQPQVIIFGGGAGHYFDKYAEYVKQFLEKNLHPVSVRPKLMAGKHPDKAGIYGCYFLVKGHGRTT